MLLSRGGGGGSGGGEYKQQPRIHVLQPLENVSSKTVDMSLGPVPKSTAASCRMTEVLKKCKDKL